MQTSSCCGGCGSAVTTVDLAESGPASPRRVRDVSTRSISRVRCRRPLFASSIANAPETLLVPSGRRARLEYGEDGTVSASVKLQELFGLAETPRIGPRRVPVVLSLLAPNGRPVQITRDLRSFWDRTYPEVRKELRGRYPKHPWPDDPWTADTDGADEALRSNFPNSGWPARAA